MTNNSQRRQLLVLLLLASGSHGIRPPFLARRHKAVHDRWQTSHNPLQIRGGDSAAADVERKGSNAAPIDNSIDLELVSAAAEENQLDKTTPNAQKIDAVDDESADQSTDEQSSTADDAPATDESTETSNQVSDKVIELRATAAEKRAEGKSLHDSGELSSASVAFHEAAHLLQQALHQSSDLTDGVTEVIDQIAEECATCRLHEALCLFKNGQAEQCVQVCSDVLGDGVVVKAAESEKIEEDTIGIDSTDKATDTAADEEQVDSSGAELPGGEPSEIEDESKPQDFIPFTAANSQISSQVRARAHLRRSKARLALGDLDGAIEDGEHTCWKVKISSILLRHY